MKLAVAVVVIVYLLKAIYSVTTNHNEINEMAHYLSIQEKDLKEFNQQSDKDVQAIQHGMANGAKEFDQKLDDFSKSLSEFADDFTSSLDAELKRREEHVQNRVFYGFVDDHLSYYDADAYEKDRQRELTDYPGHTLPTYEEYVKLREEAYRCNWIAHNKWEQLAYNNEVGRLKAEHNKTALANVRKPDIWSWPLTNELNQKIREEYFPRFFSYITQDGKCRNE
jgi:hypothetical protein